ncbi:MAG: polysaccharide deacetylase family protein [SAR324 cluster bacterium]|nr:polysaccharide deacetylase family protein [SAR324 cluster bacterium]
MDTKLGRTLPILMYHHVAEPSRSAKVRGLYVTPRQLDWQIRCLKKKGYQFVNFKILSINKDPLKNSPSINTPRQIVLTFDDGYSDNFRNAFPVLKKHEITAVIFPVVGDIGKKQVIWPENDDQLPVDLLTEKEIQEMYHAGIEFGSHLYDHTHLSAQNNKMILEQLSCSKIILEKILQDSVVSVAYPFGAYNDEVLKATAEAGYQYGLTTVSGINDSDQSRLTLKRIAAKGNKAHHYIRFINQLRRFS